MAVFQQNSYFQLDLMRALVFLPWNMAQRWLPPFRYGKRCDRILIYFFFFTRTKCVMSREGIIEGNFLHSTFRRVSYHATFYFK